MRIFPNGFLLLPLTVSVLGAGCFVVENGPLNELTIRDDAGVDSGSSVMVAEACGSPSYVITSSQTFSIDTTGRTNDVSPSCASSPGPDAFLQVDVQSGQYWHFHLRPSGTGAQMRDPVLHVFPIGANNVCNTMACSGIAGVATSRNVCGVGGEEHFGVQFPSSGRFAIAIDEADGASPGGRFELNAFQPICGQFGQEHGEGCDDNNTTDGDGCDHRCRVELTTGQGETESNEDRFWANVLMMNSAGGSFDVTGIFAGSACDVDAFSVQADAGRTIKVQLFPNPGTQCFSTTTLPVKLEVRTPAGALATNGNTVVDDGGCATINATVGATGGEFIVLMDRPAGQSPDLSYRLHIDIN